MQTVLNFLVRLVLVAVGLVFAASLALAVMILLAVWSLRMLWARLTGRPVTPFVMRVDPRSGFRRFNERTFGERPVDPEAAPGPAPAPARVADVTDVEVKEIRPRD